MKPGQRLKKGDELGYFSYGGSTLAIIFQPGAVKRYIPKNPHGQAGDNGPTIQVNGKIAIANGNK